MLTDLFKILELDTKSQINLADIKRSMRRLLLKYHPDLSKLDKNSAEAKTKEILSAYQLLQGKYFYSHEFVYDQNEKRIKKHNLEKQEEARHCFFKIGDLDCILPVSQIKEILKFPQLKSLEANYTNLGKIFKHFTGVFYWRDSLLYLFDLGQKLNIKLNSPLSDRFILIIEFNEEKTGLLIDQIPTIKKADPELDPKKILDLNDLF